MCIYKEYRRVLCIVLFAVDVLVLGMTVETVVAGLEVIFFSFGFVVFSVVSANLEILLRLLCVLKWLMS